VLLIDQLKHVYIDGELDEVDTPQYFPKILRKDFTVALNIQTSGPDPHPLVKLLYGCGSSSNWDGYCNPEVDQLIEQQSREGNPERRRPILWEIERRLAADGARPILFYASGANCRQPWVKGFTQMVNSHYNGWRMEDVWLDNSRLPQRGCTRARTSISSPCSCQTIADTLSYVATRTRAQKGRRWR